MNTYQKKSDILTVPVTLVNFSCAQKTRDLLKKNEIALVSSKSHSYYEENVCDFLEVESTRTYNQCVYLHVNKNVLTVEVWDGDSVKGYPTKIRASYVFSGNWYKIQELADAVDKAFSSHAMRIVESREKAARILIQQSVENELLSA
jgi:hypothetical protein